MINILLHEGLHLHLYLVSKLNLHVVDVTTTSKHVDVAKKDKEMVDARGKHLANTNKRLKDDFRVYWTSLKPLVLASRRDEKSLHCCCHVGSSHQAFY